MLAGAYLRELSEERVSGRWNMDMPEFGEAKAERERKKKVSEKQSFNLAQPETVVITLYPSPNLQQFRNLTSLDGMSRQPPCCGQSGQVPFEGASELSIVLFPGGVFPFQKTSEVVPLGFSLGDFAES